MRRRLAVAALGAALATLVIAPSVAHADVSSTIIAPRWVLTVRHCTSSSMSVRVGSVLRASGGRTANVTRFVTRNDVRPAGQHQPRGRGGQHHLRLGHDVLQRLRRVAPAEKPRRYG